MPLDSDIGGFESISLVGAGRLATVLAHHFQSAGIPLKSIYSRGSSTASVLAAAVGSKTASDLGILCRESDLVIIAVPDDAIAQVAAQIAAAHADALVVHSSGSVPRLQTGAGISRSGVFYPLQTFSPGREIALNTVPICVDASEAADLRSLEKLAQACGSRYYHLDDEHRLQAHLAAVFANNFSNALFGVAQDILAQKDIAFEILLPLIQETAHKLLQQSPAEAQTGPARRGDLGVVHRHLDMLREKEDLQELYRRLSLLIRPDLPI